MAWFFPSKYDTIPEVARLSMFSHLIRNWIHLESTVFYLCFKQKGKKCFKEVRKRLEKNGGTTWRSIRAEIMIHLPSYTSLSFLNSGFTLPLPVKISQVPFDCMPYLTSTQHLWEAWRKTYWLREIRILSIGWNQLSLCTKHVLMLSFSLGLEILHSCKSPADRESFNRGVSE